MLQIKTEYKERKNIKFGGQKKKIGLLLILSCISVKDFTHKPIYVAVLEPVCRGKILQSEVHDWTGITTETDVEKLYSVTTQKVTILIFYRHEFFQSTRIFSSWMCLVQICPRF